MARWSLIKESLAWAGLGLLFALAGCGGQPPLTPVSGVVRCEDQPVAGVVVTFIPEADGSGRFCSVAMTDEQGEFTLATMDRQPGALPGVHRVTIEDLSIQQAPRAPDGTVLKLPPQRFAPRYSLPQQSPLTCDIRPQRESQRVEVEVTKQ
jgi:hypothetical protein